MTESSGMGRGLKALSLFLPAVSIGTLLVRLPEIRALAVCAVVIAGLRFYQFDRRPAPRMRKKVVIAAMALVVSLPATLLLSTGLRSGIASPYGVVWLIGIFTVAAAAWADFSKIRNVGVWQAGLLVLVGVLAAIEIPHLPMIGVVNALGVLPALLLIATSRAWPYLERTQPQP